MRCMAMMILRGIQRLILRIPLLGHPLEKLSPASDARHKQRVSHCGNPVTELLVNTERISRLNGVVEKIPYNLLTITDPILARTVLR